MNPVVIWRNIANGVGRHGDFLKSFAQAFTRADGDNRDILAQASTDLIYKYHLNQPPYTEQ